MNVAQLKGHESLGHVPRSGGNRLECKKGSRGDRDPVGRPLPPNGVARWKQEGQQKCSMHDAGIEHYAYTSIDDHECR